MANKATQTVRNTIAFLRMTAAEMRRMANSGIEPEKLRHIAKQCEAEAKELAAEYDLGDLLQSQ